MGHADSGALSSPNPVLQFAETEFAEQLMTLKKLDIQFGRVPPRNLKQKSIADYFAKK